MGRDALASATPSTRVGGRHTTRGAHHPPPDTKQMPGAGWLAFFHHLSRHQELVEDVIHERFFPRAPRARPRALAGRAPYAVGGALGYLLAPQVALGTFSALSIFQAINQRRGPHAARSGRQR